MYILNIETSTKNCSVSLSQNGEIIALREDFSQGFIHSEMLHQFIADLLQMSAVEYGQLSAIAIDKGPGSYTGLRIGSSTAKGLCYALDIPLIAIESLEILARRVQADDGIIVPMIDARRMEVYTAVFGADYQKTGSTQAVILNDNSFVDYNQKIYFVGDGVAKFKEISKVKDAEFFTQIQYPSAEQMGELAYQKFIQSDFENVAYFEPFYLKEFYTG
ncbi:MAG: tRNA (adenosine(37)-N6)-threonylcarbamoyltransferase complex dimerization subunit type 1 TsaB [Bacteroidota bacterium]|nr:tRNA (adenosine(37)-N6)-threonylcarbamoyltransferase complex dimerization subunit type 1 TsaB [Bacteroidota bacterium]